MSPVADLEIALRRVVAGFRAAALLWMGMLGAVAVAQDRLDPVPAAITLVVAGLWTALTAVVVTRPASVRGGIARSWAWLAADVAVSAAVVLLPALAQQEATFTGGYPFSTLLLAAWSRGHAGALPAGAVLAAATVARIGFAAGGPAAAASAVDTAAFHVVGAVTLGWGIGLLRRADAERRAAASALAAERAERVLAEERSETAAHLHDSVLQTLALIQRRSGDPAQVTTLARSQERELRDWLAGRTASTARATGSFSAAVKAMAAEVERLHDVRIDVVTVGDTALDDPTAAVVAAAREAAVNAAKHGAVATVAVFAEVTADRCAVYVRDRGAGFDPDAVRPDRRGIGQSIVGRMRRHGGSAHVRSATGHGTEVEIVLPRSAGAAPMS